jgi:hypothetical protein
MELGDLGEEGVLGLKTSDPSGILTHEARNCTGPVGDVEMSAVLDVGRALGGVEVFVEVASRGKSALLGGYPEVGGAGVEDNSEALGRISDLDLSA